MHQPTSAHAHRRTSHRDTMDPGWRRPSHWQARGGSGQSGVGGDGGGEEGQVVYPLFSPINLNRWSPFGVYADKSVAAMPLLLQSMTRPARFLSSLH